MVAGMIPVSSLGVNGGTASTPAPQGRSAPGPTARKPFSGCAASPLEQCPTPATCVVVAAELDGAVDAVTRYGVLAIFGLITIHNAIRQGLQTRDAVYFAGDGRGIRRRPA